MPSTLAGLIIFVSLLTPGFIYLVRLESRLPAKNYSTLRETATVVTVSIVTNAIVVGAFGLVRTITPNFTPNVGEIVRTPGSYAKESYVGLALWGIGLLCISAVLAATAAVPPHWIKPWIEKLPDRLTRKMQPFVNQRDLSPIRAESSWGRNFRPDLSAWESEHNGSKNRVPVGVRTVDGSYLYGPLLSFNPQLDENKERDLSIGSPVLIRTASSEKLELMDAAVLVVSAAEIKTISVHYLPDDAIESYATVANLKDTNGGSS